MFSKLEENEIALVQVPEKGSSNDQKCNKVLFYCILILSCLVTLV